MEASQSHTRGRKFFLHKLVEGGLSLTLSDSLGKIIGLLLLPLMTFYLTPENYGTVAIIGIINTFMNLIYNPGVVSATTRLYYDCDTTESKNKLIGSAAMFFLAFPLIIAGLAGLIGQNVFSKLFSNFNFYPYGYIALGLSLFTQTNRLWSLLMRLNYNFKRVAFVSLLSIILNVVTAVLLVVWFRKGLNGRVCGMFPGVILTFCIAVTTIYQQCGYKYSLSIMRNILRTGWPLIFGIWAYSIMNVFDRFIIERLLSLESVGIYEVAYKIGSIPLLLSAGFKKMWVPMFYENMRNKNHAIVSDIMTYYLMLASTGIAIFILFAKEGFHFLIDERFNSGIGLSMIISNGLFFLLLTSMTDAYLGYYKLFTKNSLIMTVSAVFNIAINILFLREYGIIVAALSTLFSYFLFFMLAFFQVKEYARSHLQKRSFMFVAVVILSSNAVGFMTLYMGFWFTVILKISLIILLILLLSRSKMLRDDEKKYFHKTINKATRMIKMNTKQRNG